MAQLLPDLKYSFRQLRRTPGFTLAAVLTLAFGIGANTAIFSVVNGVLLHGLPYEDSDRLVHFESFFSIPEFMDFRAQASTLSHVEEYHGMQFTLVGADQPMVARTAVVSASFFDNLGVEAIRGRTFAPGEDEVGAERVVLLTSRYWHQVFGGDPDVIGRTVVLDGNTVTVVGVLPDLLPYPQEVDLFATGNACSVRSAPGPIRNRNFRFLTLFGRVAPGRDLEEAQTEISTIVQRMREEHPEAYTGEEADLPPPVDLRLIPVSEDVSGGFRPTLLILLGTVGLVLLIACVNVGNLTTARLARRDREVVVRAAMGAGRGRLVRQLLVESVILGLMGGLVGLGIAYGGLDLLKAFASRFTVRTDEIGIDATVLLFTLLLSVLAGIAFGVLPALQASKRDLATSLKEGAGHTTGGRRRLRLRGGLIVVQVAVSFLLLVGAGLLIRSLVELHQQDPGYDFEQLAFTDLRLAGPRYDSDENLQRFYEELFPKLLAIPGVKSAALAVNLPLFDDQVGTNFEIEGRPNPPGDPPRASFDLVSSGYFETFGIPLLKGRNFDETDTPETPPVVIVNRTFAERHWPDGDPLGQRVIFKSLIGLRPERTIIGVVGDVQMLGKSAAPPAAFYIPFSQQPVMAMGVFVRTSTSEPSSIGRQLVSAVHDVDSNQPVGDVRTAEQVRGELIAPTRTIGGLLGLFAAIAFLITAVGMSGVTASSVAERTQEIGIRSALGAPRPSILGTIVGRSMALVLAGLAIGLFAALLLTRVMSGLLFQVTPKDPVTFATVSLVLIGVVGLAALIPARRATRVDPVVALRVE